MLKPLRIILAILLVISVLSCILYVLLNAPQHVDEQSDIKYISNGSIMEIKQIDIKNQYNTYKVWQEQGGFIVHDIPAELVNGEYLKMLLDESSTIEYIAVANENLEDLSLYGLDEPIAKVRIQYMDNTDINLEIGKQEPVSKSRYCKVEGENRVLLMKDNRSIRFTMPLERYIKYVIIPPCNINSPLSIVKDITFSGTLLPEPIVIEAVDKDNAQDMRDASSFGVATHLIRSPGFHEIDQTEAIKVFNSLMGLISEEVVEYNCNTKRLEAYGFDEPWLQVEFDYQNKGEEHSTHVVLKVVKQDDELIATKNDEGVVYRIQDVEFTKITYEKMVMRWFLTPLITDVSMMKMVLGDESYTFKFSGDSNKSLKVELNGQELDMDVFRKYYSLIISAENDGERLINPVLDDKEPLLVLEFSYRDTKKQNDIMKLYKGSLRRVFVEINEVIEFAMRENYVSKVKEATIALKNGEPFSTIW